MTSTRIFRSRFHLLLPFSLALCTLVSSLALLRAQDVAALGLPERRALKQYQETKLPELQKNINAAAKFDVPLEINWGAIAQKDQGASYQEDGYFTDIYFVPLTNAFKKITADAMGAEALKAKLKKVIITFDQSSAPASNYAKGVNFDSGTLTINFYPYSNTSDTEARSKAIASVLEAKL